MYSARGLPPRLLEGINDKLMNCKVKNIHLDYTRKFRGLGPSAVSDKSKFCWTGQERLQWKSTTHRLPPVTSFTASVCPMVACGTHVCSRAHPVLIPMELVVVVSGQNVSHKSTPDLVSQVVKSAAIPPDQRFRNIVDSAEGNGTANTVGALQTDEVAQGFGVTQLDRQPLRVPATLLPPPKLRYHTVAEITSVVACMPASLVHVAILDGHRFILFCWTGMQTRR